MLKMLPHLMAIVGQWCGYVVWVSSVGQCCIIQWARYLSNADTTIDTPFHWACITGSRCWLLHQHILSNVLSLLKLQTDWFSCCYTVTEFVVHRLPNMPLVHDGWLNHWTAGWFVQQLDQQFGSSRYTPDVEPSRNMDWASVGWAMSRYKVLHDHLY